MGEGWRTRRGVAAALVCLALFGAACSDDEDTDETGDDVSTTAAPEDDDAAADGETIEVTAIDYEFEGMPDTVAAGSTISLTTEEGAEPHEMIVLPFPDGEDRSVDELVELPEAELQALFTGEPVLVTVALPGLTDTPGPVVGDGTISEPGRYLFLCTFPEGTTVEDVQNAQGPIEGAGPPHFVLGMRGEFTVE